MYQKIKGGKKKRHPVVRGEHPLPVRMGAKHSVTLSMGDEPPLPVRMGAYSIK